MTNLKRADTAEPGRPCFVRRDLSPGRKVVVASDDQAAWLGENAVLDIAELRRPYPSEAMHAYRVSTAVNSVKNSGPECVEAP